MQILDCREIPEEYLSCHQLTPYKVYEVKEGYNKGSFYTIWHLEHNDSQPLLIGLNYQYIGRWHEIKQNFNSSKFKEVSAKIIIENKE